MPTTHLDVSLLTASRTLAAAMNDDGPTLYDTVTGLWKVRADLKQADACHTALRAALLRDYHQGVRRVGNSSLQLRPGRPASTKLTVRARDVERRNKRLYMQSKVRTQRVSVSSTADVIPVHWLPDTALPMAPTLTAEHLARVADRIKGLRAAEDQHKKRLVSIAECLDVEWDGADVTFTDRWRTATYVLQFSKDRLREIDPDAYERYLVEVEVPATADVLRLTDADGEIELDELDGA